MNTSGEDLCAPALAIARIEYPSLEPAKYIERLDAMGEDARSRLLNIPVQTAEDAVSAFNEFLYDEQGFRGNRHQYDDPRNSFLNEVLDRRTGIPISLAVVYMEVARRAGIRVAGVNFPGHFLLRADADQGKDTAGAAPGRDFRIIDPFHGGARLSEGDCRELLRQHVGDNAAFDEGLLQPATRHDIIVRMLVNLKRLYVRMRSFPQARFVSDLLLTVAPSAFTELRDRGLLAYHLEDFAAALRDLEAYLRMLPRHTTATEAASGEQDDDAQIWEHVKSLRKRVAGFN